MRNPEHFRGLTVNCEDLLVGDQGSVCYADGRRIGTYPYGTAKTASRGVWVGGKFQSVHQIVARAWNLWWSVKHAPIVHLNGERSDNRLANLRVRAHTPEEHVYRNKHSFSPQDEPDDFVGVGQDALDDSDDTC